MPPLVTLLGAILAGVLVMLGIGGISYHLFRDEGWISRGLGAMWDAHYQTPIMVIILIFAAIYVVKSLHSAQVGGKRESKIPDLVLYAFIATGVYFLGRLLTLGEI